jgi:hypothetical protein
MNIKCTWFLATSEMKVTLALADGFTYIHATSPAREITDKQMQDKSKYTKRRGREMNVTLALADGFTYIHDTSAARA